MTVKLLTEHDLEFLTLKGGCTGSSVSTHVKILHCWNPHVTAHIVILIIQKKRRFFRENKGTNNESNIEVIFSIV